MSIHCITIGTFGVFFQSLLLSALVVTIMNRALTYWAFTMCGVFPMYNLVQYSIAPLGIYFNLIENENEAIIA